MFRSLPALALGALATLSACTDPATAAKIAELETKVGALEETVAKLEAGGGGGAAAANNDQAALELYRAANGLAREGDTAGAKEKLQELMSKFGGSKVAAAGQRLLDQLNVVGKEIADIEVTEWYQGEAHLADSKATLLVFWEVWCPHCKREVPKLQETYTTYKDQGLGVIGLTKLTRGKTPEDVKAFMSETELGYPIGKESGAMSDFFGVSGVPAAAVVKDGAVVWRGHPAQLTDDMIKGWL